MNNLYPVVLWEVCTTRSDRGVLRQPGLLGLAKASLYIGVTGFGGTAIVGYMKRVFVDEWKWLAESDFLTGLSLSQMLPGAIGVSTMEFVGYRLHGLKGAAIAAICFVTPAFAAMTCLAAVYFAFGEVAWVKTVMNGLNVVAVALLANAVYTLTKSSITSAKGGIIGIGSFVLSAVFHLKLPLIIAINALLGLLLLGSNSKKAVKVEVTRRDGYVRNGIGWALVATAAVFGLLVVAMTVLKFNALVGILKVGALAFGGGFSAIPILHQETVGNHHLVTDKQFLDGLALGQVTPGPVLITATFVGYHAFGILGAVAATLAVFGPACLAMLFVAPYHANVSRVGWVKNAVAGMTCGFMGILAAVAIRLGSQSITDWRKLCLALIAFVILAVWRKSPLVVVFLAAIASPLVS